MATPLTWLTTDGCRDSTGAALAAGTVEFVSPSDPNTRVNVYTTQDETAAWSQPITLDSGGRASGAVYVKDPCRIRVSSSAGTLAHDIYYPGHVRDNLVEIKNSAFTGSVGAATAAGQRTWLGTLLSRAITSFGGTDWKHLDSAGGVERSYVEVVREFGISVKSYGATSAGVADSTTAIKAAIAKLKANGGGLLTFPPGTYLINDELAVDFAGCVVHGVGHPTIRSTVNNKNIWTATAAGFRLKDIDHDVAESVGGNSTGHAISLAGATDSTLQDTNVLGSASAYVFARGLSITAASERTRIINGRFRGSDDAIFVQTCDAVALDKLDCSPGATGDVTLDDCTNAVIHGCYISGNIVLDDAAGACTAYVTSSQFYGNLTVDANSRIVESGNRKMGGTITNNSTLTTNKWSSLVNQHLGTITPIAATVEIPMWTDDDVWDLAAGTGTITTITATRWRAGCKLTLHSTGAITVTDNTGNIDLNGGVSFVMAAGDTLELVYVNSRFKEIGRCDT